MSTPCRLAINGAAGRMGQRLVALASADPDFLVVAALEHPAHRQLGEDAGRLAGVATLGVPLSASLDVPADVMLDFSTPSGTAAVVTLCRARRLPVVVATTGLEAEHRALLDEAAQDVAVFWSPSMSLAVNLAMRLTQLAATALRNHPGGADVEIIERHHRFKEDAPSGTALRFGQLIGEAMGLSEARHGRQGRPGQRPHDEIGYHAVRSGDNPGEHTIVFGLLGETLEVTVKATNRDCYAQGALAAAKFLRGQAPGSYSMADALGQS